MMDFLYEISDSGLCLCRLFSGLFFPEHPGQREGYAAGDEQHHGIGQDVIADDEEARDAGDAISSCADAHDGAEPCADGPEV